MKETKIKISTGMFLFPASILVVSLYIAEDDNPVHDDVISFTQVIKSSNFSDVSISFSNEFPCVFES